MNLSNWKECKIYIFLYIYLTVLYIMKKIYFKLIIGMVILTVVLYICLVFATNYLKNDFILKKQGNLVHDSNIYYNVKGIIDDYITILSINENYKDFKTALLKPDSFSREEFEELVDSYDVFNIYTKEIYSLGNNTYRCNYTLLQDTEQIEGFTNYEDMLDENVYNNTIVIKVNKKFINIETTRMKF